jgi:chloramphenicol 3-O-phosphotransferase
VLWLVGGPSVGKSSIARAVQDAGGAADAFVLAGDQHLQRVLPTDALVRYVAEPADDGWPGWSIPFAGGVVTGRPHAGPTALRILDGMYGAAAAMAAAGNNVVLEDVVWEPAVADLARRAFHSTDLTVVRVSCDHAIARQREHRRRDRFDGAVAAFHAADRAWLAHGDVEIDTSARHVQQCAADVLDAWRRRRSTPLTPVSAN